MKEKPKEEEEEKRLPVSTLTIGDIEVGSSKSGLKACKKIIEECLKSRTIKNYLNGTFRNRKIAERIGVG